MVFSNKISIITISNIEYINYRDNSIYTIWDTYALLHLVGWFQPAEEKNSIFAKILKLKNLSTIGNKKKHSQPTHQLNSTGKHPPTVNPAFNLHHHQPARNKRPPSQTNESPFSAKGSESRSLKKDQASGRLRPKQGRWGDPPSGRWGVYRGVGVCCPAWRRLVGFFKRKWWYM